LAPLRFHVYGASNRQMGMRKSTRREMTMGLLWLLVLLLIIFALVGGVAVNSWLFIILVIALILLLVGYV
jgi:diacylglycerol kinase